MGNHLPKESVQLFLGAETVVSTSQDVPHQIMLIIYSLNCSAALEECPKYQMAKEKEFCSIPEELSLAGSDGAPIAQHVGFWQFWGTRGYSGWVSPQDPFLSQQGTEGV